MRFFIHLWLFFLMILFSDLSFAQDLPSSDRTFSIEELTIDALHDAIKNKKMTCERLIDLYLDRIKKYNLSMENVPLNALTEINLSAKEQARQLDQLYSTSHQLAGTLHCVPVVIKDNIDTYDVTTTSGSFALLGTQPVNDAFLVKQLRGAGAIIIAKSAMDELASGMKGISSRSGRVGNAYRAEKNAGGSSGGSAVAVSANFAILGVGTDNSGSVRIPAAFNGIVGLRPSMGLISQRGIFPAGNLDGTAGPMARNVKDLAIMLDVIVSENTPNGKARNDSSVTSYVAYLNQDGLRGKRIGVVHRVGDINTFKAMPDDVMNQLKKSLQLMQAAGAVIVDDIQLPRFNNNRKLNMAGMREEVNQYLASFPAARKNFDDICESNRTRVFGNQAACVRFVHGMPKKSDHEYKAALKLFAKNKDYVENIMNKQQLDALLIPISTTGIATDDPMKVNTWQAPVSSNAGLPSITLNVGYIDGMPFGIEMIGKQFAEGTLIEMAYAYERHTTQRIPPALSAAGPIFANMSIAAMNNLFTLLGSNAYQQVLKKGKTNDLTADKFKQITINTIKNMKTDNTHH